MNGMMNRNMNRMTFKICGLTRPCDVLAAVQAGAAFCGFVNVPNSPRYVTLEEIRTLLALLPPSVGGVCVVRDASLESVQALIDSVHPLAVQLHGNETPEFAQSLHGAEVWKAFHLRNLQDAARAAEFPAARIIADSASGGSGQTCDWPLVAALVRQSPVPVFVAGGITPQNAAHARKITGAAGVDLASGVESAPGIKSELLLKSLQESLH